MLYGVSFQQFRHFDITDQRGASDAVSYIKMSHGDFDVKSTHRYRFVIPLLVELSRSIVDPSAQESSRRDLHCFYLINFLMMAATSFLFFYLLRSIGFCDVLALIGISIFISSRATILATGTPLIDSFYYLSIVCVLLGILSGRIDWLVWAYPVLILSKETIIPILLLPLLTHWQHRWKLFISIGISALVVVVSRQYISQLVTSANQSTLSEIIARHAARIESNLGNLFTIRGLHDLQNGFSFFLLLGIAGFAINHRYRRYSIPKSIFLMIPLTLMYGLLSRDFGRMLFASSFIVIPYALICIEHVFATKQSD